MPAQPETEIKQLYQDHYHEVLAYCIRRVGFDDADDVVSEVFTIAWRKIDQLRPDTARAWLFGISRRVLANRWRSALRYRRLQNRVGGLAQLHPEVPEVHLLRREEDQEVIDSLRLLRRADQEVLMLAAWEGLTAREIAVALGVSPAAAEQRLHRAKRRLAAVMRPSPNESEVSPRAAKEGGASR